MYQHKLCKTVSAPPLKIVHIATFTALAGGLGSQLQQTALGAIATIVFLGTYLIALFDLYVCFPTNIDVLLQILKGAFLLLWSFDFIFCVLTTAQFYEYW